MVKLFVGNLADGVDSHRLRNLFLQYVHVQECDVLKNFAFVHVNTEEDAEKVIEKLSQYNLEGREIHIERSTSRLRKEPGMSDKCFTCGATDHKTPSCPQEANRRIKREKRGLEDDYDGVVKKPAILPTINLAAQQQQSSWACKVGGGNDGDPELPCPTNPELRTLYDQYLESRTRYFFYRDRLSKELSLQSSQPMHMGRIDMTRSTAPQPLLPKPMVTAQAAPTPAVQYAAPVSYVQPAVPSQAIYASGPTSVYAASAAPINAVPAGAYATQQATLTAGPQQVVVSSTPVVMQPSAPYNTIQPQRPVTYTLQPPQVVNGGPPPSAPYASNATYRPSQPSMPLYAGVHYSTIPSAQR